MSRMIEVAALMVRDGCFDEMNFVKFVQRLSPPEPLGMEYKNKR